MIQRNWSEGRLFIQMGRNKIIGAEGPTATIATCITLVILVSLGFMF